MNSTTDSRRQEVQTVINPASHNPDETPKWNLPKDLKLMSCELQAMISPRQRRLRLAQSQANAGTSPWPAMTR